MTLSFEALRPFDEELRTSVKTKEMPGRKCFLGMWAAEWHSQTPEQPNFLPEKYPPSTTVNEV
jgi:hypothetical protein